jgi:photosystem II stability/assembly factor-like uncharacterized protein
VTNNGGAGISQPFRISVLPGSIAPDGNSPVLDPFFLQVAGLAAGETLFVSRAVEVPAGVTGFDVRVEADIDQVIGGSDQSQRVAASHFQELTSDVDRWVCIGPTRITADSGLHAGGILFAMAVDPSSPSTIYVGSAGSGLWKTTDGGASWRPISDSLPTLAVAAIAVDPSASSRVYVATPNFGVFRSEDGGTSWRQLPGSPNGEIGLAVLLVHPTDPDVLYLTTREGVFRSVDRGATWSLSKAAPPTDQGRATDLVMALSNPNVLYVGIAGQGLFRTTDGGVNWTPMAVDGPPVTVLSVRLGLSQNVPGRVYALFRSTASVFTLFRTNDSGASWSAVSNFPAGSFFAVLGVDCPDPSNPGTDVVYLGGVDFFRSTAGGAQDSFQAVQGLHVDHHAIAKDPAAPSTVYSLNDGGIYRSLQRGQSGSWAFIGDGITNVEFYDIALAVTEPDLVIGGTQDNGNIRFDGTTTVWAEMDGFGDGATVAIDPTDARVLYAMPQFIHEPNDGGLSKSTDRGASFQGISRGLPLGRNNGGCVAQNAHFQVHPTQQTTLLAAPAFSRGSPPASPSPCGGLYRTTTNAPPGSWSAILQIQRAPPASPVNFVRSTVDASADLYYAATDQGQIFAGPGGAGWQNVFTHPQGAGVTDLEIDPDDPSIVYTAFGGSAAGTTGRLFRLQRPSATPSTVSATDITFNLPVGRVVQALAVDRMRPLTVYAGTEAGVFRGRSIDGGATWAWMPYANGLPAADIRDLEVHPVTGVLRAATFGRSAFEVNTDFPMGSLLTTQGRITFLRIHDVGTGFGPPTDFLDVEAVVILDSEPRKAFGVQLRSDEDEVRHQAMLDLLRDAFREDRLVSIDYVRTGIRGGRIERVAIS